MGDEPRRSVRATKGHHSKIDMLDEPPTEPKKKSAKKGAKKAVEQQEEEEEEEIRCVCGAISTDDSPPDEPWIACDECAVWQHNTCMDISPFGDEVPENYKCEQHDPVFHKELLDAMARGVPIWEERKKKWAKKLKAAAAGDSSKKGGKKGKTGSGKRASEANGNSNPPSKVSTPVPETKKATPAKSSAKRKDRHESGEKDTPKEPMPKIRKVTAPAVQSPQQKTPPSDLPVKILDLDTSRQGAATLMKKALEYSIPIAAKTGIFKLTPDDTIEGKAERLSIRIEDAIYKTHPDKSAYGKQSRSISSNLKQNQELTIKLLQRTMSPSELAVMSTDDMASSQLKQETAKMKALSDKQSILLTDDDGPRIRKTHKGEEIVGRDDYSGAHDSMSSSRRRSMLDPNADMAVRSRENSPGNDVVSENIDDYQSRDTIRQPHPPGPPLNIETQRQPVRKQSSHADFDINKVFNSVQSPTGPPSHVRRQSGHVVPATAPANDPDIDKLLQDDDGNESPPYSPAEYGSADPEIIWRGTVIMDSIATFSGSAKHVAGADLTVTTQMRWHEILQKELRIAGRIDQAKANEYLCSLRYSPPTDVVIVNVTPAGETAASGFRDMFEYFHSKTRYGVLTNKGSGNIRDTYLVPVATNDPLPDFIINLEGHHIAEVRVENIMLVVLVIRNEWQPPLNALPLNPINYDAGAPGPNSPSAPTHPAMRNPSLSAPGPAMSPITGQSPFPPNHNNLPPSTPSNNPPASHSVHSKGQSQAQIAAQQRDGEEIARRILGDLAQAPTIGFLMPQAFQMRPLEWEVIRGILERDDRARTDLTHLSQVLNYTMSQQGPEQQQQQLPLPQQPQQGNGSGPPS